MDKAKDELIDELEKAHVVLPPPPGSLPQKGFVHQMFAVAPLSYVPDAAEAAALERARAAPDGASRVVQEAGRIAKDAADEIRAEMERAGVGDENRRAAWDRGLNLRLTPRKSRLITNAKPLNRHVEPWHYRMHDVWTVLEGVRQNGWMAKADIRRGFYHLRTAPDEWRFFSFYHRGQLRQFRRIPMGLCTSPGFFSWVTAAINLWLSMAGVAAHLVYLDDFVVAGDTYAACAEALALLKEVCAKVGIELAGGDKTSTVPVQKLVVLGVEVDLVSFTVTIPADRLIRLGIYSRLALDAARAGEKVPTRLLTSIAGRSGWISLLNPTMRLYTSQMDRMARSGTGRVGWRHVPKGLVRALKYIVKALERGDLRGETLCPGHTDYSRRTITITSDASKTDAETTIAFRLDTDIQVRVELPGCLSESIDTLELLAVVGAVRRWGPSLRGCRLVLGCDNAGVVEWIDSGRSQREDILQLLRKLFRAAERYDLNIVARWLPRWFNYRNDRVASLPRAEALEFAPDTIVESEDGDPLTALRQIERMSA
jgi:hypothetical protein